MEPTSLTRKQEYERYLELSRMLGTKITLLIESSTDTAMALHLQGFDHAEAELVREAYCIYKSWDHSDPDASE